MFSLTVFGTEQLNKHGSGILKDYPIPNAIQMDAVACKGLNLTYNNIESSRLSWNKTSIPPFDQPLECLKVAWFFLRMIWPFSLMHSTSWDFLPLGHLHLSYRFLSVYSQLSLEILLQDSYEHSSYAPTMFISNVG